MKMIDAIAMAIITAAMIPFCAVVALIAWRIREEFETWQ